MRYALAFIIIFMSLACTTTKPSITEFKLYSEIAKLDNSSTSCKDKTIKISKAFADNSLMSLKMSYIQDENKVFEYSQSQWVLSPAQAISKQIFFSVRDSELFKHVNINLSRSKSEYLMEIIIEDFMQYYDEKLDNSYANVKININVIDLKDSSIVANNEFSSKIDAKTLDAEGGVEALNTALSDVIEQNIEWLVGVCK